MKSLSEGVCLVVSPQKGPKGGREEPPPLCYELNELSVILLSPKGLDFDVLHQSGQLAGWESRRLQVKLAYVVHLIIAGAQKDSRLQNFFVPIQAVTLQRLLGSAYAAPALRALQSAGVVECNRRYSSGRFPKSYRLAAEFRSQPVEWRIFSDATLAAKLRGHDEEKTRGAIAGSKTRETLLRALGRLSFSPEAHRISQMRTYETPHEQAAWLMPLVDIEQGRHWLRHDAKTGRVFHSVAQCPSELRRHLLVDGERTIEVDMANAQPFFLLSLYDESEPERAKFASVVSQGLFYETVFEAMPKNARRRWGGELKAWAEDGSTHRSRFKTHSIIHILYSTMDDGKGPRAVFEAFRKVFPVLAEIVFWRRTCRASSSAFACEMQRREADLVIGRVIPGILAELPGCVPVSIHDGILCQEKFAAQVAEIFEREAERIYGVRPRIKIKGGVKTTT